ncbi:MAG: T9SS type A sorting domain-containing protein, partial [Crocinitomicaceae bacterium]|nr:T9SS type A sorting domain-containing protein [Crocinitomicaceae bacterium]
DEECYEDEFTNLMVTIYPNPAADLIAIQIGGLVKENLSIEMIDLKGAVVGSHQINAGQTIAYFDVSTVYAGSYFIRISNGDYQTIRKVMVK